MTGHDAILTMRRNGLKPAFVWVSDHPKTLLDGVTVRLAASDVPEQQDWRFLVGVTALVEGPDQARVDRIAKACAITAKRVIAVTSEGRNVACITDTEGALTWRN